MRDGPFDRGPEFSFCFQEDVVLLAFLTDSSKEN